MATKLFAQAAVIVLSCTYIEKKCLPESIHSFASSPSPVLNGSLPRAFGFVILAVAASSIWLVAYGLSIGKARLKYMERATKDGEPHVKERYGLPNLYVESVSKHARAFNCVQRSHQQTFETFSQFVFFTLASGLSFPLTSALTCMLWLYSRMVWANGYAQSDGDPAKRYSHPFSKFIWIGFLVQFLGTIMTALNFLLGGETKSFFW